jgi:hypothetical protein
MTDKVAACVREVIAIASGDGAVSDRHKAAEQRVARLLKSEDEKTLSHQGIARDFHDRLGVALNAEHDPEAREVLDKVIDSLRAQIDDLR